MPVGMTVLLVVSVLIFLGLGQRVLDRLRLTDKAALLFLGAMLIGGFLPDLPLGGNTAINIGGGIVPLILVVYLIIKAGTVKEKTRAIVASLVTGIAVYVAAKILPVEPTYTFLLDPIYWFAVIAGVIGYLSGRSRRTAFIAGVSGLILMDIFSRIELLFTGGTTSLVVGGAGVFDGIVIAGFISLALAEVIGETRERLQGGPSKDKPEELLKGLSAAELGEIEGENNDNEGEHNSDEGGTEG